MTDNAVRQWCMPHWAPYSTGELNGIFSSMLLMEELLAFEPFMHACGYDPATGAKAEAARMNDEMIRLSVEYGGICCALGTEVMDRILFKTRALNTRYTSEDDVDE